MSYKLEFYCTWSRQYWWPRRTNGPL